MEPVCERMELIEAAVFVLRPDANGRPCYVWANTYMRARAGLTLGQLEGRTARDLYPGRHGAFAYARHAEALRSGRALEYELALPLDGTVTHIRTHLAPRRDDSGRVVELVGTAFDLGPLEAAREAALMAQSHSAEVEQFVAMAAHDLRSPMRNVASLAGMLREDLTDAEADAHDIIRIIEEVAQNSAQLIDEVLGFVRTQQTAATVEEVHLGPVVGRIAATLDPQARHGISAPEVTIRTDRIACQIVLRNLIDNALKHGRDRRVTLDIGVRADALDDHLVLTVTDDGTGFDDPGLVFLETGEFRTGSGYGLLAIKRLLGQRGGWITAGNRVGMPGGVVTFSLPGVILAAHDGPAPPDHDAATWAPARPAGRAASVSHRDTPPASA